MYPIVSYQSIRRRLPSLCSLLYDFSISILRKLFITNTSVSSSGNNTSIVVIDILTTPEFISRAVFVLLVCRWSLNWDVLMTIRQTTQLVSSLSAEGPLDANRFVSVKLQKQTKKLHQYFSGSNKIVAIEIFHTGWPLVWKTWKCQGIWNMSGKCQWKKIL